jgi:DNA-binding MurR/RpiR family transcriptional regulator
MAELTPAERRVGRTLLTGYPVAGLSTVADLAAASATSSATVVRLAQKLSYGGYPQLQAALLEELSERQSGPVQRIDQEDASWSTPGTLARQTEAAVTTIGRLHETIPQSEFDAAVDLIADPRRRILLVGGRITGLLADYLQHHLARARGKTGIFPIGGRGRHAALLDIDRRDVLVVLDVRRYAAEVVSVAEAAAARGAVIVLLTDVFMSPAAAVADVVLPVPVEAPSPFDTSIGLLVAVEALATAVIARLGDSGVKRIREWDALADG